MDIASILGSAAHRKAAAWAREAEGVALAAEVNADFAEAVREFVHSVAGERLLAWHSHAQGDKIAVDFEVRGTAFARNLALALAALPGVKMRQP